MKNSSFLHLSFLLQNQFVWEVISNTRHSVSSQYQKPRSSSKILQLQYVQLSSLCLICDETLCLDVFDKLRHTNKYVVREMAQKRWWLCFSNLLLCYPMSYWKLFRMMFWPSKNRRSGVGDRHKKYRKRKRQKIMHITKSSTSHTWWQLNRLSEVKQ